MLDNTRKAQKGTDINGSSDNNSAEMNLDVLEWLESERLEYERRMQHLGLPLKSRRSQLETNHEKDMTK